LDDETGFRDLQSRFRRSDSSCPGILEESDQRFTWIGRAIYAQ